MYSLLTSINTIYLVILYRISEENKKQSLPTVSSNRSRVDTKNLEIFKLHVTDFLINVGCLFDVYS